MICLFVRCGFSQHPQAVLFPAISQSFSRYAPPRSTNAALRYATSQSIPTHALAFSHILLPPHLLHPQYPPFPTLTPSPAVLQLVFGLGTSNPAITTFTLCNRSSNVRSTSFAAAEASACVALLASFLGATKIPFTISNRASSMPESIMERTSSCMACGAVEAGGKVAARLARETSEKDEK